MSALPDGIYFLTRDEYDRIPRVNWSKLKHLGRSAAHFRHHQLHEDDDTDAKQRGRATHLATWEPELYRSTCVIWDCGARRGKDWEQFKERNAGKEILTEGMNDAALAIAQAARSHPVAQKYMSGKVEVTVLWTCKLPAAGRYPAISIECKSRLDSVADVGSHADLKTTRDASPFGFGKACLAYEYHVQGAFYVDAYKAVTGQELPYRLIAVEEKAPHVVQVYRLTDEQLELGRERYRELLFMFTECRRTNAWLGYSDGELDVQLPKWAFPFDDDADAGDLGITIGTMAAVGF